MPTLEPISVSERIEAIDILRGFALFGILAANMRGFNSPAQAYFNPELMWTAPADRAAQAVIDLIRSKFITLFSFLFGLGFAVQMERAESRGGGFAGFYSRRLGILLLIGLAHGLLVWWGDILVPYALIGFLLLLFRRRRQKTVLWWAVGGIGLPAVMAAVFLALSAFGVQIPGPPKATPEVLAQAVRAYGEGSFGQILAQRMKELAFAYGGAGFFLPRILGVFLLGFYIWRRGILQNVAEHLPLLAKAARWGVVIGLAGNVAWVAVMAIWKPVPITPSGPGLAVAAITTISIPALSCFYAAGPLLLLQNEVWRRRLEPLGAVGRTALSNYLLQSVVCTTLFYSYGLGLYGKVGPALGLIPTFILYLAQIPVSVWWVRRFRFGPMEWVWRSLAYGRFQSMRLRSAAAVEA